MDWLKKDIVFPALIFSLMFGLLSLNVFCYLGSKGIVPRLDDTKFYEIMGRDRQYYVGPDEGRFFAGIFQKQLEHATEDHFPFDAILFYKKIEYHINKAFLTPLPPSLKILIPVDGNICRVNNSDILIEFPKPINQACFEMITKQAKAYNGLIKDWPKIRLIIIPILSKGDWFIKSQSKTQKQYFDPFKIIEDFQSQLNPKIVCSYAFENFLSNDAIKLYYETDHHLNMRGAYIAYCQLIHCINGGTNKTFAPLVPNTWSTLMNVEFRGSLARKSFGLIDNYDLFEDANFDLPQFKIFINGKLTPEGYGQKDNYQNGLIPKERLANHYGRYFGGDNGLMMFLNTECLHSRNLLMVSDSFDNSIVPLISFHFQHSFFVDLRHFYSEHKYPFNISDFIRSNQITDVVFMGEKNRIMGLSQWKNE